MSPDTEYLCEGCGEMIVIPVDPSAGRRQEYVEDCPVCCHPNIITLSIDEEGRVHAACVPE